jgi:hypothetical protein
MNATRGGGTGGEQFETGRERRRGLKLGNATAYLSSDLEGNQATGTEEGPGLPRVRSGHAPVSRTAQIAFFHFYFLFLSLSSEHCGLAIRARGSWPTLFRGHSDPKDFIIQD